MMAKLARNNKPIPIIDVYAIMVDCFNTISTAEVIKKNLGVTDLASLCSTFMHMEAKFIGDKVYPNFIGHFKDSLLVREFGEDSVPTSTPFGLFCMLKSALKDSSTYILSGGRGPLYTACKELNVLKDIEMVRKVSNLPRTSYYNALARGDFDNVSVEAQIMLMLGFLSRFAHIYSRSRNVRLLSNLGFSRISIMYCFWHMGGAVFYAKNISESQMRILKRNNARIELWMARN